MVSSYAKAFFYLFYHVLEVIGIPLCFTPITYELKGFKPINFISQPGKIDSLVDILGVREHAIPLHLSGLFKVLNIQQLVLCISEQLTISFFMRLIYFFND